MSTGNGAEPMVGCLARHDMQDQLRDDMRMLSSLIRGIDARTQTHDTALGQLAAEMAFVRRAAEHAAEASVNTLAHVDQWQAAATELHAALAARVRALEQPSRAPISSGLDFLSDDTKANATDPGSIALLRELNAARERAAAAEAALATREQISEQAVAGEKTDAELELEKLRIGNARWKIVAGIAIAVLTTLGGIVTAFLTAKGYL